MSLTKKTDIRDSDEKVVEIEMERLRAFTNHVEQEVLVRQEDREYKSIDGV